MKILRPAIAFFSLLQVATGQSEPLLDANSYNQWKDALKAQAATPAQKIKAPPGFAVELLRSAGPDEGSWIALAFDSAGRAIISREDRGLLQFHLAEGKMTKIDDTLAEVRGLLFAHGALYAHSNNGKALFRLRDADGDGTYEKVDKLRETPGGVGHGRNQMALGPDGGIYLVVGDDVQAPETGFDADSPFQTKNAAKDSLLPAPWDKYNWSHRVSPPCGHLVRTDADGKSWKIICGGLRNPFGLAIDPQGEMFTYDADIEWDIGLPWYRPTRILHLVSGAEYGWRGGSQALPAWFADTQPAQIDIGKGSPTGCLFGTHSRWPEPWRSTLFALDWAYGRIHAVSGTQASIFLEGRPLNVTSATFGPDGELYFLTGGRRTLSGLYRVRWLNPAPGLTTSASAPAPPSEPSPNVRLRRKLETFHGKQAPQAVSEAWPALSHTEPEIRQAARIAIESQSQAAWLPKAAAESNASSLAEIALILARTGSPLAHELFWKKLPQNELKSLPAPQRLRWLRALQIIESRNPGTTQAAAASLLAQFPFTDPQSTILAGELLSAQGKSAIISPILRLLAENRPQEERLAYLFATGKAQLQWTQAQRQQWLESWSNLRRDSHGGPALGKEMNYLLSHFLGQMPPADKEPLAAAIAHAENHRGSVPPLPIARPFVKAWTVASLMKEMDALTTSPDLSAGKRLFGEVSCFQCHRVGPEGGEIGPDLTAITKRFDRRSLIESVIEPWKVVAEQYRSVAVTLKSGAVHTGRVVLDEADVLKVATNPIEPGEATTIPRSEITSLTDLSAMPPGLFQSLTASEVRDLLAWLETIQ